MAFGSVGIHVGVTVGLDPGRDKVGWAFVGEGRELLVSGIFPAGERALFWLGLRARRRTSAVHSSCGRKGNDPGGSDPLLASARPILVAKAFAPDPVGSASSP